MHPGFLFSQMFSCQQPVASAQDTAWHGRLPLQNSLCSFVRLYRRPCKVHCCAARKGKAMTQQKMRHQTHTRQLSSGRLKRLCQEESRLEGLKPSSTMAEPGSSDQEGISEDDEAASPSSQPTSVFGGWVGSLSIYVGKHLTLPLKDAWELPTKLHYPSRYETGWKSATVLLAIVVAMVVVSTLDNACAAAIVWYMRRALWLSSKCTAGNVFATVYCMALSWTMLHCAQSVGVCRFHSGACEAQESIA